MRFVKHMPVSLRHLIPLFFVLSLIVFPILSLFYKRVFFVFLAAVSAYIILNLFFSLKIALKKSDFRYFFILPAIFLMLHVPYGVGSVCAGIKIALSSKKEGR